MHQLVPQFILEKYSAKEKAGSFEAVSLFIDIAGFSKLTDQLMREGTEGSEKLADIMRSVFNPLINTIYHYDGFVATLAGDAINAIFPNETIYNALECVSHMPFVLENLKSDLEVSARFGLAYGSISWGIIDSEDKTRAAYFFDGQAIHNSADTQREAGKNEICVHSSLETEAREAYADFLESKATNFSFSKRSQSLVPEVQLALAENVERLAERFFPQEVLEQKRLGEFRQIVNVFIHLPTIQTETQLRLFMQTLFDLQDQYGALLNRLDFSDKGTHLYLIWGAPLMNENDPERALSFVLDLQNQTSIAISAGLSYRMANANFIGSPLREEYTCYGRGVNLAARLMVDAPRGEIWLDEELRKRAEKSFDMELEGEFAFKGFSNKQKVFVLYERKEESERFFDSRLVACEEELSTIAAFLNPIFKGEYAGNLLITGEAGAGKSHLLHELTMTTQDVVWLNCHSHQILLTSLNPFAYALKRYFGITDAQGENRNKRNFNRKLNNLIADCENAGLAEELDRTKSFLGVLLGLRWPDSLYEELEPKDRLENSFLALMAFFQTLSLEQPLVVLIEDAHWLDEDSKTFLVRFERYLSTLEENYPIALVITSRPGQNVLSEELSYETLPLGTLDQTHIHSLTTHLLGEASEAVVALIFERSQGNPFFAEQVIRFLQDESLVEQKEGVWQLTSKSVQSTVPGDVRTVLVARIDRLSKNLKDLVQTAAVLGREFEVRLLSQIMQTDDLSLSLNEAEKAAIWTALNELRYLFKHGLLRDAAYDMQLLSRRKALHKMATEALEELYKDDLSNSYAELAYHSECADLVEKAKTYLELAGDSAKEAYQNEQAIDSYSRALALTPVEDKQHFEVKLKRVAIYAWLGQHEQQADELAKLNALAERFDRDAKIRVLLAQASYCIQRSLFSEVISIVNQAIALCDDKVDIDYLCRCHISLAYATMFSNNNSEREQFYTSVMQLVSYAERTEDEALKTESLRWQGLYYRYHDDATAKRYFEEALASTDNLSTRGGIFNRLGSIARRGKDFDKAKIYYQQALEVVQQTGRRYSYCLTLYSFAQLYQDSRDYDSAASYFAQVAKLGRELGNEYAYRGEFAEAHMLAYKGHLRQAIIQLSAVYERFVEQQQEHQLNELNILANYAWRLGEVQQAKVYRQQFLEVIDPLFTYDVMTAQVQLANIYLAQARFVEADEAIQKAQAHLADSGALKTSFAMLLKNLDVQKAAVTLTLTRLALQKERLEQANTLMVEVLNILTNYETQHYAIDDWQYPSPELFYQAYKVLVALGRAEATHILGEAYRRIMDLSQSIGKTEVAQRQVWIEDRFRRGIVEAWQKENSN